MRIATDYLVVGAGASGLAFADSLAAESDADIVLVDRRAAPGGHWGDAYPFVVLHTPSAYYGVDSLPLGSDRIDETGPNAGFYERATGSEVLAYFGEVAARLEETGRVRVLLGHEHLEGPVRTQGVRELASGQVYEITVRRKVVDARYQEATIPATHRPSFEVAADANLVPVGGLPDAAGSAASYVVLGAGKTAVDACLWLLANDVDPDRIQWVRARDAWHFDRSGFQALDLVVGVMEGLAADAEAAAQATDFEDLVDRLEAAGRLTRIDPTVPASMLRGAMLSAHELAEVRRITDVIRLGWVRRVERDRIVLGQGDLATGPDVLVIDCSARGLGYAPEVPIFQPGRIVLQQVRHKSPTFNAALLGFVEAHRDDDEERNRLCPPNALTRDVDEWPRTVTRTWQTEGLWVSEPDVSAWVAASRLNLLQAFPAHQHEPEAQAAVLSYLTHVGAAIENLERLAD